MLTLENLKAFSDDLKIIQIEVDELLKIRSESKLFTSSDDYYLALKACKFYPQDYFKLRIFDYDFCLRFNRKMDCFYIHTDSVKSIDNSQYDISIFIDKWKIYTQINNNNYYIRDVKDFNQVIRCFCEFIVTFIKYYLSQDKLFSYEL